MLTLLNIKYYNLEDINKEHKSTDSPCLTLAKVCLQIINKTYDFKAVDQTWTFVTKLKPHSKHQTNQLYVMKYFSHKNSNDRTRTRIATTVSKPAASLHKQSKTTYDSENYF